MQMAAESASKVGPGIYLVNWAKRGPAKTRAAELLNQEDHQLLSHPSRQGQGYVIRVLPEKKEIWLVGGSPQGVLYAAATLLQILESAPSGLAVRQVHIRDFPDFRYRAAADWLLFAEANRWAYDWGDGRLAYIDRIKRKLDLCLLYKINMVFFDGFGWNSERFPGYAAMMREVNGYARQLGIKLVFAGYGANYRAGVVHPERNVGKVWYNRESYPDGKVYPCFGNEQDPGSSLGTCRGNEELNQLKAKEMANFVRAVEPGALYIHQEGERGFHPHSPSPEERGALDELWRTWKRRCERCRHRWPNDSLIEKDGGAGAVAHAYSNLLHAINSVTNEQSGYDAARDCTIVFMGPGYKPISTEPSDWENHLRFWGNVISQLPSYDNFEIGTREFAPSQDIGRSWVETLRGHLSGLGLKAEVFFFFVGGADHYSHDSFSYPFSGTAAMNGLVLGAEAIYNFSGSAFQEPLQLLNSEFSWNTQAPGHRIPTDHEQALATWEDFKANRRLPQEIIGPGGLLEDICKKLYGDDAGLKMMRYLSYHQDQPRVRATLSPDPQGGVQDLQGYLLIPELPERLYPLPVLWKALELDRELGGETEPERVRKLRARLNISSAQWQERWARLWELQARVNSRGSQLIAEVLQSPDLKEDARLEVEQLEKRLVLAQHFSLALASYHELLLAHFTKKSDRQLVLAQQTRARLEALSRYLEANFSLSTLDPVGGDQASWSQTLLRLKKGVQKLENPQVFGDQG